MQNVLRRECSGGLILSVIVICGIVLRGEHAAAMDSIITPDIVYGHKAGMALTFDMVRPQKPNGAAILFMVSGGWVSNWKAPETVVRQGSRTPNYWEAVVDEGYTLFLVRHGSSPFFKVPDAVADVRRAVRFIRLHADEYQIDPERIGVYGMSAGGHLSLMLATTADSGNPAAADPVDRVSDRVKAVVAVCPPSLLQELLPLKERYVALKFPEDQLTAVSPLLHASADDAIALLIHGDKDELVPISHSERMTKALTDAKGTSELLVIPGAGHAFVGPDQLRAQGAIVDWFNRYLAPVMAP